MCDVRITTGQVTKFFEIQEWSGDCYIQSSILVVDEDDLRAVLERANAEFHRPFWDPFWENCQHAAVFIASGWWESPDIRQMASDAVWRHGRATLFINILTMAPSLFPSVDFTRHTAVSWAAFVCAYGFYVLSSLAAAAHHVDRSKIALAVLSRLLVFVLLCGVAFAGRDWQGYCVVALVFIVIISRSVSFSKRRRYMTETSERFKAKLQHRRHAASTTPAALRD